MMPVALYNLLLSKAASGSFIAWYPFCEGAHTTGYTPNVANQSDGSTLKLALTDFEAGESCGDGTLVTIDGKPGYLKSDVRSETQLTGDLTMLLGHRVIDASQTAVLLSQSTNGEDPSENVLYWLQKDSAGNLIMQHEYDNGTNIIVVLGISIPLDTSLHFIAIRRDTVVKRYESKIDSGSFVNSPYTTNPNGGSATYFQVPPTAISWNQADGYYRNIMLFNERLTDEEIQIIQDAGDPQPDWFSYLNWNGTSGYVTWVVDTGIVTGKKITENKDFLGFKLETNPFTPETLTVDNYKYHAYDVKIIPDIGMTFQKHGTGDYSRLPGTAGKKACAVNFKVDVYSLSDPASPPAYFEMLRACGWRQIVHGSTGISIIPGTAREPATIEAGFEDESNEPRQLVYKIGGSSGRVKLIGRTGRPVTLEFSFVGSLESITTRSYANRITPASFDSATPPALLNVNNILVLGHPALLEEFEIDSNEVVNLFTNIFRASGYGGASVSDRIIYGNIKIGAIMSLTVWHVGGVVAIGHDDTTGERGFLTKYINGTGGASVKGSLVTLDTVADNTAVLQTNMYDSIGVVAEGGVANGEEMWVWKNGSRCQVLYEDGKAATHGNVLISAATDGRAEDIANFGGGLPAADIHFKENGHVSESKSAGTNVLALAELHFN